MVLLVHNDALRTCYSYMTPHAHFVRWGPCFANLVRTTSNIKHLALGLADPAPSRALGDGYILLRSVLLDLPVQLLLRLVLGVSLLLAPGLLLLVLVVLVGLTSAGRRWARVVCICRLALLALVVRGGSRHLLATVYDIRIVQREACCITHAM